MLTLTLHHQLCSRLCINCIRYFFPSQFLHSTCNLIHSATIKWESTLWLAQYFESRLQNQPLLYSRQVHKSTWAEWHLKDDHDAVDAKPFSLVNAVAESDLHVNGINKRAIKIQQQGTKKGGHFLFPLASYLNSSRVCAIFSSQFADHPFPCPKNSAIY